MGIMVMESDATQLDRINEMIGIKLIGGSITIPLFMRDKIPMLIGEHIIAPYMQGWDPNPTKWKDGGYPLTSR